MTKNISDSEKLISIWTSVVMVTITVASFQTFCSSLYAQNFQKGQSVFQSRIDDVNAVYLLKGNFAVHGDGIGDDAPALQAAINLAEEQSINAYGVVFIPEGMYRLGKTIYLWRGIRLIGYGKTRPVFVLGNDTPGFQEGSGNYMIQFCDRRFNEGEPVNDAANTTYFSGISNINVVIEKGNPAAVAIRYHVAQHCSLNHMDFQIGSALAGVEDIGNVIESCNFSGGQWGIKTGMTSPGWQALILDCNFEAQRKASIQTEDAGMTVIRCRFYDAPKSVFVPPAANERLFIKDCLFENIGQSAISVNSYFDPLTQLNLKNLLFSNVPVCLEYYGGFGHGTSRTIPIPDQEENGVVSYKASGPNYCINDYCHGLILEIADSELRREFNTIHEQELIDVPVELPEKDYPDLPTNEKWVNIVHMGAKGDGKTDDTKVFKKAIKKYTTIYIPTGNYLLSETLTLKDQTALIGLHPSLTRFCLKSNTPGFNDPDKPAPLVVAPRDGSNLVNGIGFFFEVNPGAIAIKWMAGSKSYMNDTFFFYSKRTKKGEGEYYGLWVTDGGGGTFKNIWGANQQGRRGLYISNTTTEGRMYEISVEHHKEVEIDLDNVSNWNFYNMQTEEDGGSEKSIAIDIDHCTNIEFANNLNYRVKVMQTPAVAAFEINNSDHICINGSHVFSWGAFPYDNSVYVKDLNMLVPQHDFSRFILK
jgi:hypothetical protein